MKVFLEIAVGDVEEYKKQVAAYDIGLQFIKQHAAWVLEESQGGDLDQEKIDTLSEMVPNYPDFSDKGPLRFTSPKPLPGGKLEIKLFNDVCPKACQNFYHLCIGDKGLSKSTKKPLHYLGSTFFRLVPGFIAQGGDFTRGDGSGGDSIFNGKFNDEKGGLALKFTKPGQLGMANSGKNSNTSQFFFTLPTTSGCPEIDVKTFSKLNGKYVLFGEVTSGFDVLKDISNVPTFQGEVPSQQITIVSCGSLA
ncbi:hypothetical protein DSO57_1005499 [Entomophthora muscae]|uniref:Uncharacterized protein n=1 Tax=Entomophthora muscae TaxID=34485 RepID=A0ACC2U608_9FUNG|nr:hypothetical protein DSO57_1005499 [Entomophthora muscae]